MRNIVLKTFMAKLKRLSAAWPKRKNISLPSPAGTGTGL